MIKVFIKHRLVIIGVRENGMNHSLEPYHVDNLGTVFVAMNDRYGLVKPTKKLKLYISFYNTFN